MDPQVTAGLIMGVVSLLVATTSLISAILAQKHAFRTTKAVELLKHDLERAASRRRVHDEQFAAAISALNEGASAIQRFKDQILLILNAVEDSLPRDEAIANLAEAQEQLISTYAEHHSRMNDVERTALHDAKNTVSRLHAKCVSELECVNFPSDLNAATRSLLSDARIHLSDCQARLLQAKTTRLFEYALPRA